VPSGSYTRRSDRWYGVAEGYMHHGVYVQYVLLTTAAHYDH